MGQNDDNEVPQGDGKESTTSPPPNSTGLVVHESTEQLVVQPFELLRDECSTRGGTGYALVHTRNSMTPPSELPIALGVPGQIDGLATLQSDRGDEVQALFRYQWTAGVVLLVGASSKRLPYHAIWCEHHDDLLAELPNDKFHAVQVKTKDAQGVTWKATDSGFIDAIRKFSGHEALYSSKLEQYIFYSNRDPYIPAATATKDATLASSPVRVRDACRQALTHEQIAEPYKASFNSVVERSGCSADSVYRVFRKLEFQRGLPLEEYREHLRVFIGGLPKCDGFTLRRLQQTADDLLFMVGEASSLEVKSIDLYSSILQADGRPLAAVRAKRLSVEDIEIRLNHQKDVGFRYADVGGYLQLGTAPGQKDILRKKMNAGYVGNYFSALWVQALSAERKLLEEAVVNPEAALRKSAQLQNAVLVACKTAEAEAALESDERKRGALILTKVLARIDHLVHNDAATVENERAETLRGIAGLLSGSCHFAWGMPVDGGEDGA